MTDKATPNYLWDCSTRWPIHDVTLQAITAGYTDAWSDPLSLSAAGRMAGHIRNSATAVVAQLLRIRAQNVLYTTSLPASLDQLLTALTAKTTPIVAYCAIEHAPVLRTIRAYHQRTGAAIEIPVDRNGHIELAQLAELLEAHQPGLLFCQWANAEIGTIQDLEKVATCCAAQGTVLVVDASAGLGYLPPPTHWDILIAPAQAWGGPQTTTLIAHREQINLELWPAGPLFGQESTADVLATAVSLQHATGHQADWAAAARPAIAALRSEIAAQIPQVDLAGDPTHRVPHILTASIMYCHGETLLRALDQRGFTVGSGSACMSVTDEPSHVLAACGRLTHGNIRLGIAPGPDAAELLAAAQRFVSVLATVVSEHRAELGIPTAPGPTP